MTRHMIKLASTCDGPKGRTPFHQSHAMGHSSQMIAIVATIMVVLALITQNVMAQDAEVAPANVTEAQDKTLNATIVEVGGLAQVRNSDDAPWQAAEVGIKLNQGAAFRTGPRSYVKVLIEPNQIIALDRLGVVKILQAVRDATNKVKTDLGMKYGRTRFDVEAAGEEHESTIYSPTATLAIRGTDAQALDGYGEPAVITSRHGRISAAFDGRDTLTLGGTKMVRVDAQQGTPSQTAKRQTTLNPRTVFSSPTQSEFLLIEALPGLGGFDPSLLSIIKNSTFAIENVSVGSVQLSNLLVMGGWIGTPMSNVDLAVVDPLGNVISSTMPSSSTGGVHAGDAVADMSGAGVESVVFALGFPSGTYQIKLDAELPLPFPITAFIEVRQDDVPIKMTGPTISLSNFSPSHTEIFSATSAGKSAGADSHSHDVLSNINLGQPSLSVPGGIETNNTGTSGTVGLPGISVEVPVMTGLPN